MIVLWFYFVMTTGSFGGTVNSDLSLTRPQNVAGPFRTAQECDRHRGDTRDRDGVSRCVSIRVRWLSRSPPPWAWVPPIVQHNGRP